MLRLYDRFDDILGGRLALKTRDRRRLTRFEVIDNLADFIKDLCKPVAPSAGRSLKASSWRGLLPRGSSKQRTNYGNRRYHDAFLNSSSVWELRLLLCLII